jgi:hypothetical protein
MCDYKNVKLQSCSYWINTSQKCENISMDMNINDILVVLYTLVEINQNVTNPFTTTCNL